MSIATDLIDVYTSLDTVLEDCNSAIISKGGTEAETLTCVSLAIENLESGGNEGNSGGQVTAGVQYLSIGTQPFTADLYFKTSTNGTIFSFGGSNIANGTGGVVAVNSTNKMVYYASGYIISSANNIFVSNEWTHVAFVGDGSNLYLFINGVLIGTQTVNYNFSTSPFYFGSNNKAENFTGYFDKKRLIIGKALWTANFTPPVAPT